MFGWFKKKDEGPKKIELKDLDHNLLQPGDEVESLRYELGRCVLVEKDDGIHYESIDTKKSVHWTKMIDASTELQKVKKLEK